LFNVGLSFDLGIVYTTEEHEFGFNIITPRISITPLSYSSIERQQQEVNADSISYSSVLLDPDFKAIKKVPIQINLGYAWFRNHSVFKVRLSFSGAVAPYVMGKESHNSYRQGMFTQADQYDFLPVSSSRSVVNLGLGYEWRIHEKLKMVTGARTDFTFMDKSMYRYADFSNTIVNWNIYHISAGIDWSHKWLRINAGFDYGFSYQKGISEFFNPDDFNKPIQEVGLSTNTHVLYQQVKIFLGLILSF